MKRIKAERKPTKLWRWLKSKGACAESLDWVGRKSATTAIRLCKQRMWMCFLMRDMLKQHEFGCICHDEIRADHRRQILKALTVALKDFK